MLLITLTLCVISDNFIWLVAVIIPVIVAMAMATISRRILGGITGDILGAVNEITEVTVLFGAYIIYLGR